MDGLIQNKVPRRLPLLLALLLPAAAFAAEPLHRPDKTGRTLTVVAEADAEAAPDAAIVSLHFVGYGWTADKSRKKTDELVRKFLDQLKKEKIQPAEIELGAPRLKPSYQFNRDLKADVPADFLASRQVLLRLEDLSQVDKLMDASVSVGSFLVESAFFTVKDREGLEDQAFSNALKAGRRKAERAAKSMDASLGELVSVEQLGGSVREISVIQDQDFAALAAGKLKRGTDEGPEAPEAGAGSSSLLQGAEAPKPERVRASSRLRLTFSLR